MKTSILLLSSGLLLACSMPALAQQVPITGGSGRFGGARFMSPTTGAIIDRCCNQPTGTTDNRGTFYQNNNVQSAIIRTQLGNIPTNARIETTINPALNNAFNRPVAVGDRTEIPVRLSFRLPSANGGSVFFNRLPARINATFTEVPTATGTPIREYISPNYLFTEVGRVNAPGATAVVRRETDVNVVQYTNGEPKDITVVNRTIPAADFTQYREGTSYTGDYKFDITGGNAGSIDTTIFTNAQGNQPTPAGGPPIPSTKNPKVHFIVLKPEAKPTTEKPTTDPNYQVFGTTVVYVSPQTIDTPVLGNDVKVAYNTGYDDKGSRSNCKCQGDVVLIDQQRNLYVPVGVPSRIFPGLMGMQQIKP
ncbi:MAG: hypothetical protein HC860_19600 [Alkalinema sp. RU_4_3]|nr:hypothetical protein [Alkalinema sp. RU_4_3]